MDRDLVLAIDQGTESRAAWRGALSRAGVRFTEN